MVELQIQSEQQVSSLQAQLDRKEYQMQRIELKVYTYEKYLQRKALVDKEALELLHRFEARVSGNADRKVTNVVETNLNLRQELKDAMQEINTLQLENVKLTN